MSDLQIYSWHIKPHILTSSAPPHKLLPAFQFFQTIELRCEWSGGTKLYDSPFLMVVVVGGLCRWSCFISLKVCLGGSPSDLSPLSSPHKIVHKVPLGTALVFPPRILMDINQSLDKASLGQALQYSTQADLVKTELNWLWLTTELLIIINQSSWSN